MEADLRAALSWFDSIRNQTETLCRPLIVDDYGIQSMPDVSPPKWHLGHTTWFFEEFLLPRLLKNYHPFHPQFRYLLNSYYKTVGPHVERSQRGLLSRPSIEEIYQYRTYVSNQVHQAFKLASHSDPSNLRRRAIPILVLGGHHEQQHQELLLTDILHIFASNPLRPVYLQNQREIPRESPISTNSKWIEIQGGMHSIGFDNDHLTFAFDNERPRHCVFIQDFRISMKLVTCGDFLEFIEDGGYHRPDLWLSDGWGAKQKHNWTTPLYWERIENNWWKMTLAGMKPIDENAPVSHVSYYEADAYARWRGHRLPTEFEWEAAASHVPAPAQLSNVLWQWTLSAYLPYPGFRALEGSLGEYNQKFMCNQMVLRGGSFATPPNHVRLTYRNFFPPDARWQFSGIRLAS